MDMDMDMDMVCNVRCARISARTGEVVGPAHSTGRGCGQSAVGGPGGARGGHSHGVVLRVVAETLGSDWFSKEEGQVGEDVLSRSRDGAWGGQLRGACLICGHLLLRFE